MPAISAGLVLYRHVDDVETGERRLQVLLVHPDGPYWVKKDAGAWSIPKGLAEPEELGPEPGTVSAAKARNRAAGADLLAVARRRGIQGTPIDQAVIGVEEEEVRRADGTEVPCSSLVGIHQVGESPPGAFRLLDEVRHIIGREG